mgnify:FL=1
MKKTIIVIVIILIVMIVPILILTSGYKQKQNEINKFNLSYEKYKNGKYYGSEIGSIINNAINNNEKKNIQKDADGRYIDDDNNYIQVKIQLMDNEEEKIYDMEILSKLGIDRFVKNFNLEQFECKKITYNSIGRVNRIVFEICE